MTYEFDDGGSASSGSSGPYLSWHARETLDGSINSRSFSIRDEDGNRKDVTDRMKAGVAIEIDSLRTGWCYSDGSPGVAPEWLWNESPARFDKAQPEDRGGERWKKGFTIRIAVGKQAAQWSQSGAGSWQGLVNLMAAVKADGGSGETAIVCMTGTQEIKFKKGSSSNPTFRIKKWADKPDCLKDAAPAASEAVDKAKYTTPKATYSDGNGDDEF